MKKSKGITLIALIITIIVLLILAGVSLRLVAGNEGILGRAEKAVTKNDEASAREKLELELQGLLIAKKSGEEIDLMKELGKEFIVDGDIVIVDGYQFQMDEDKFQISTSLGKGSKNENIRIEETLEISEDQTKCILTIEINYNESIDSVKVAGKEAREQDGKYVIEITENGTYTIVAKNSAGEYNTKTITISDLKEDLKISTVQELVAFAQSVNAGETYQGKVVRLKNDLDLKGMNWEPIGSWRSEEDYIAFKGTFDGENHVISHLKVHKEYQEGEDYEGVGFFGVLEAGSLKNLKFNQPEVYSEMGSTGIAVGYLHNNGSISDVEILNGNIEGAMHTGGVCGAADGKIQNCGNSAIVTGNQNNTGGIVGYMEPENGEVISYCYNKGDIISTSSGQHTGGIVRIFWR